MFIYRLKIISYTISEKLPQSSEKNKRYIIHYFYINIIKYFSDLEFTPYNQLVHPRIECSAMAGMYHSKLKGGYYITSNSLKRKCDSTHSTVFYLLSVCFVSNSKTWSNNGTSFLQLQFLCV